MTLKESIMEIENNEEVKKINTKAILSLNSLAIASASYSRETNEEFEESISKKRKISNGCKLIIGKMNRDETSKEAYKRLNNEIKNIEEKIQRTNENLKVYGRNPTSSLYVKLQEKIKEFTLELSNKRNNLEKIELELESENKKKVKKFSI